MTPIIKTFFASCISLYVATSFAATTTNVLELEANFSPYVNLIGSSVGVSKFYTVEDINPPSGARPWVAIGSLGIESNVIGTCTINFSSKNNFRLRHLVSNQRLTNYIMRYKGNRINRRNTEFVFPTCNEATTSLQLRRAGNFRNNVRAGIYQDIVTITVTTE